MSALLIVVHPGSACGSADFSLGEAEATRARKELADDLDTWSGPVVVIDGDLSAELRRRSYRTLGAALDRTLQRAAEAGHHSLRIRGDNEDVFDQAAATWAIVADLQLADGIWRAELTGAWFDPDQSDGCVNSVAEVLEAAGVPYAIRESAVRQANVPASIYGGGVPTP